MFIFIYFIQYICIYMIHLFYPAEWSRLGLPWDGLFNKHPSAGLGAGDAFAPEVPYLHFLPGCLGEILCLDATLASDTA